MSTIAGGFSVAAVFGPIGRSALEAADHFLNLGAFTRRLFALMMHPPREGRALVRRAIFEQVYFTAVQALTVIVPFALIVGSMLMFQFARVSGQYELGRTVVLLIVRELGPVITALLVILRSATAVTVEIGYMNVLHEIEAVEMAGIDPMRIVCIPRLIGITSAILSLFIVFDIVSILGGYLVVWLLSSIPLIHFFDQIAKAVTAADITVGLVKAILFGVVITVTCLYRGFGVRRRITNVPVVASKAAIECALYCMIFNVGVSVLFYV
jgi:phospholipid/cholesterol/gamma-HCH transport system permease protein